MARKKHEASRKPQSKREHITTITGPQAQALLDVWEAGKTWTWEDKSVPGCAIVELWTE